MPHKFIAYKAVDQELISSIRENQHEVFYASDADEDVTENSLCQKANEEAYIMLTGDEHFAEDLYVNRKVHSGIMYIEDGGENVYARAKAVLNAIDEYGFGLMGHYSKVNTKKVKLKSIVVA